MPRTVSDATRRPDTGVFWDEALNLYLKGTINVNFYNNIEGFYAGDTISGTIDIEIGEYFEAADLVIELKGVERSHMQVNSQTLKEFHREVKEIISLRQVVVEFERGSALYPGQYSYPFQVFTPTWLP